MKKIAFICPYFGKLPTTIELWLKTCSENSTIDWLLFIDDKTQYDFPKNVKVNYISFSDLKNKIKEKYKGIDVKIENPYKLCDYKPLYGDIFSDYILEYDFWGYCDLDCIFGNLRKFFTDELLNEYDRLLFLGHMSLYKNTKEVNERYKIKWHGKSYKDMLEDENNIAFDENYNDISINTIYRDNHFKIYIENIYADISCLSFNFRIVDNTKKKNRKEKKNASQLFLWNDGNLYSKKIEKDKIVTKEYCYVHFQKRKVLVKIEDIKNCRSFIFRPNEFIEGNISDIEDIKKNKKVCFIYKQYFVLKYKNLKIKLKKIREKTNEKI